MQNIKEIELPDDVTYRLTKIKAIKNPDVLKDVSVHGDLVTNPLRLGHSCVVSGDNMMSGDGIVTTKIVKLEVDKERILVHTENSVYELREVHLLA